MSTILVWLDFRPVILENIWGIVGIISFAALLNIFFLRIRKDFLKLLLRGGGLVFLGLVLFLQGVNIGFMPAGQALSEHLGSRGDLKWLLVPLGFVLGFILTRAEPSVKILCNQVEKVTSGSVPSVLLEYTISLGVAFFTAIGIVRIITGFSLMYVLAPGYLLALILMIWSSRMFIGIAFDSATVSTGPMIITFIMALAMGLANVIEGRDPLLDGFGLVAMIGLAPVVSVMIVGVLFEYKISKRS